MLKYRAVKKKEIPEEVSARHKDFSKVVAMAKNTASSTPVIKKIIRHYPWAAAACLLIMLSGISYAVFFKKKTVHFPINQKKEKVLIKKKKPVLAMEHYTVPAGSSSAIDFDSIRLIIPGASLNHTEAGDSVTVKVSGKYNFKSPAETTGFCFYIDFDQARGYKENPMVLEYTGNMKKRVQFYYGGGSKDFKNWEVLKDSNIQPVVSATMIQYQHYIEQKNFIDSIKKFYVLVENEFIIQDTSGLKQIAPLKSGDPTPGRTIRSFNKKHAGMRYKKDFVVQVTREIKAYRSANNFDSLVAAARSEWRIYHRLVAAKKHLDNERKKKNYSAWTREVREAGWYGIVANEN